MRNPTSEAAHCMWHFWIPEVWEIRAGGYRWRESDRPRACAEGDVTFALRVCFPFVTNPNFRVPLGQTFTLAITRSEIEGKRQYCNVLQLC